MFKKFICFTSLCVCTILFTLSAQQTFVDVDSTRTNSLFTDSLNSVKINVVDTLTPRILRVPDSLTSALLADSLSQGFGYPIFNNEELIQNYFSKDGRTSLLQKGTALPKGEVWVLITVMLLIMIFAVLKQTFSKQLFAIIQSFFSNRALSNLNKEDNLFTSWPFLLLFAQFGFTVGLFFYLTAQFKQLNEALAGFPFYVTISLLIIGLYALKIVILRLLGFIFNVQKAVNEYISILYLSYFNASLLFMPLVLAFALSPLKYGIFYIAIALILLAIIFTFQFIRAGINILSNYRFSKVYLFLYFCTLEICPILILIKAIGF